MSANAAILFLFHRTGRVAPAALRPEARSSSCSSAKPGAYHGPGAAPSFCRWSVKSTGRFVACNDETGAWRDFAPTRRGANPANLQFVCAAAVSQTREMRWGINPGEQLAAQILLSEALG